MARLTAQERRERATALYAVVEQLWRVRFGESGELEVKGGRV